MALEEKVGVTDAVLLDDFESEDAFIGNLKERYDADRIYTYIGNVVVSVNPYTPLPIYTPELIQEYVKKNMYELPPHVFAVTNIAYRSMRDECLDQVVIISGESGAGKTEASKRVMEFVSGASSGASEDVNRIKDRLLKSNPLLESFGNAKTNRNDNSSRFGKYMDIEFNFKGECSGGTILNYLLEKSRVIYQQEGERNFHIFYNLLAGASPDLLSKLGLSSDPMAYKYLNQGGAESLKVKGMDDAKDFKQVESAMATLGFSDQERDSVFEIVAAIILLGDVTFDKASSDEDSKVADAAKVATIAGLLGMDAETLVSALTSREVRTASETVSTPLSVDKAAYARDAFAKSVYDRLFTWIVKTVNKSLLFASSGRKLMIGVLDIYGFEIMGVNGFEQLCINYCNEKLQQLFIELTLKSEQEEYAREGIDWVEINYFNNQEICTMVEGKQGVITIMDDECIRPGEASDQTLLEKFDSSLKGHAHYSSQSVDRSDKTLGKDNFRIKHFAGDVTYDVNGFMDKNNDLLFVNFMKASKGSSNDVMTTFFSDEEIDAKKRPKSAATKFKESVNSLMDTLSSKTPSYIRCIKPNGEKRAHHFDDDLSRHQVRYLGLMENLRVRRAGFAYRQKYEIFLQRYKPLCPETWPNWKGPDAKSGVKALCEHLGYSVDDFELGKTKLFIRLPRTLFTTEEKYQERLHSIAAIIQSRYRGFVQRRWYLRYIAARKLQAKYRGVLQRRIYVKTRLAAIKVQSVLRVGLAKKTAAGIRKARKTMKEFFLGYALRNEVECAENKLFLKHTRAQWLSKLAASTTLPKSVLDKTWSPEKDCPPAVAETCALLKAIYMGLLQKKYRATLAPARKQLYQDKIALAAIFEGKTKVYPASFKLAFKDARTDIQAHPKAAGWAKNIKKTAAEDTKIHYALGDVKVLAKGKQVDGIVVLTDGAVIVAAQKDLKFLARVPYTTIKDIVLDAGASGAMVLHLDQAAMGKNFKEDAVLFVPKYTIEFAYHLNKRKANIPFAFGETATQYLAKGKEQVLKFAVGTPDPKKGAVTKFKDETSAGLQIVHPDSPAMLGA